MIACLDWSGSGEGSSSGRSGGKKAAKGAGSSKGAGAAGGAKGAKVVTVATASARAASTDATLAPPMFLTTDGAPALERHRPALAESEVQRIFEEKRAIRESRIAALVAAAEKSGRPAERIVAAIIYDSEHAPHSTNRAQLAEIGVACPSGDLAALSDAEAAAALWRVIYGLAYLGIFLCGTDHLSDRAMLRLLCSRILEETIRDVPPSRDMSEFIDLTPCRDEHADGSDGPDGLEGPFDSDGDDLDDLDDGVGRRAPHGRCQRDALLPRPRRDAM
jgi:hypothetical protein